MRQRRFHRFFVSSDAGFFLIILLLPELGEGGLLVLRRSDAVHQMGEPRRRRFGIILRKDEAALEHGFQEDEDAEEVSIRASKHDCHHAANDGEMNDDDAAESYLAEPLNPGERPIS